MKPKIIILLGFLVTAFACNIDDNTELNIDGQYMGAFERNGIISNVELNLTKKTFSGQSDRPNFPAIFFGDFSQNNRSLNFDNKQLIITTEFDPNLILDGNWSFEKTNNSMIMTNSIGDIYILTKQ